MLIYCGYDEREKHPKMQTVLGKYNKNNNVKETLMKLMSIGNTKNMMPRSTIRLLLNNVPNIFLTYKHTKCIEILCNFY